MLLEPIEFKSMDPVPCVPSPRRYRPRRTVGDRVELAVLTLAAGRAQLLSHEERPWASITFSGSRHELALDFGGAEAVEAGETFIADLPDYEFTIPGQLVAEATITKTDHSFLPEPRLVVTAVLLLLEES